MKIIHCADLGLKNHSFGGIDPETGLNKRFLDVYNTFISIIDKAIVEQFQYFIIAGDINEERNPESTLIEKFCIQIKRLIDHNIKVIIIAGNHDVDSSAGRSTSISYLKALKLPNLYISDTSIERFEFKDDDITFHCYPYLMRETLGFETNVGVDTYINTKISEPVKTTKYNILVAHYSTDEMFKGLNVDEPVVYISSIVKGGYNYTALGHIHKYEMYERLNVIGGYSGSIYIKNFGENNDKFINEITIDQNELSYKKVQLNAREFIEYEIDAEGLESTEIYELVYNNLRGQITGKIIKIRLKCYNRFNPKPIYEFLREQKAFHFMPISWNIVNSKKDIKFKDFNTSSNLEIVKQYLDSLTLEQNRHDKMYNFITDTIKEVEKCSQEN
jgi:DNA repair protein SbcD/Mre11